VGKGHGDASEINLARSRSGLSNGLVVSKDPPWGHVNQQQKPQATGSSLGFVRRVGVEGGRPLAAQRRHINGDAEQRFP
jgi:hypothetical protein